MEWHHLRAAEVEHTPEAHMGTSTAAAAFEDWRAQEWEHTPSMRSRISGLLSPTVLREGDPHHSSSLKSTGPPPLRRCLKPALKGLYVEELTLNKPMKPALVVTLLLQDQAAGKQRSREPGSTSPACKHSSNWPHTAAEAAGYYQPGHPVH